MSFSVIVKSSCSFIILQFKQKQKGEQKVVQKRAVFDRVPVTLGSWQKGTSKKQREKEKLKRAIDYRDFVVRRHQVRSSYIC